jgi:hypothetical protein
MRFGIYFYSESQEQSTENAPADKCDEKQSSPD